MVRTVKSLHEEDDNDFSSRTPDGSSQKGKLERKSNDGKVTSHRSKHSETEQRRRIKINERFQTLREIIPQNDQKRDRASFLFERSTSGPVESFVEQSQIIRNGSTHGHNIAINPALLGNAHSSVEPNLMAAALYRETDDSHIAADEAVVFNMPLQPNLSENALVQPSPATELCTSQTQSLFWPDKQDTIESDVLSYGRNDQEEVKVEGEEAGISNAYSQRLLDTVNQTLTSMGVDISQANVRIQLDIGKTRSSGATATALSRGENYDHAPKRLRTEGSM
ncbi:unnamed protein product [Withania somnifera]